MIDSIKKSGQAGTEVDERIKLSDQLVRFLMIWEDGASPAAHAADILAEVILCPDAKAKFVEYSEDILRDMIAGVGERNLFQHCEVKKDL